MTITSIEAKCAKCGVIAAVTEIRSNGYSFQMKPGPSLDDHCPVIIERKEAGKPPTEDECPNLKKAINARIELFRKQHP